MKRPFFFMRASRDWKRREGWSLIVIIAPFPEEEQVPGELTAAYLNMEVRLLGRWPFVDVDIYAPCRDRRDRIAR